MCVCSVEWYSLENCRGPIPGERMGRAHRHPIRFAKFRQVYANGDSQGFVHTITLLGSFVTKSLCPTTWACPALSLAAPAVN